MKGINQSGKALSKGFKGLKELKDRSEPRPRAVKNDDGIVFVTIRVPKSFKRELDVFNAQNDTTLQAFVLEAIREKMNSHITRQ